MSTDLSLAAAVDLLRQEIRVMIAQKDAKGVNFEIKQVEVELSLSFGEKSGGGIDIKVFGLIGLSGKADTSADSMHKIKLLLTPSLDGRPVLTSGDQKRGN